MQNKHQITAEQAQAWLAQVGIYSRIARVIVAEQQDDTTMTLSGRMRKLAGAALVNLAAAESALGRCIESGGEVGDGTWEYLAALGLHRDHPRARKDGPVDLAWEVEREARARLGMPKLARRPQRNGAAALRDTNAHGVELRYAHTTADVWPGCHESMPLGRRGWWAGTDQSRRYLGSERSEALAEWERVYLAE